LNWTPVTATLSLAVAVIFAIPDNVAPASGEEICTVGGVVLLAAEVEKVKSPLTAATFSESVEWTR